LGRSRRESGHNRVPRPPAIIITARFAVITFSLGRLKRRPDVKRRFETRRRDDNKNDRQT
jgi:hypothetical protein